MLKLIGYVSFIFAALLGLLLIGSCLRNMKKRSKKARKEQANRVKLYAIAAVIFFIVGMVLLLIPQKNTELKRFISEVSPESIYQSSEAVEDLPSRIYAVGDDYYIVTGDGMTYGHLAFKEEEKTVYKDGLCYRGMNAVVGGDNLLATLDNKGVLRLSGAFEYLKYEQDPTVFYNEKYAKDCSFAAATENNLMYVAGGNLYSAGYNAFGRLGDGTERNRIESSKILEYAQSVSVSDTHTLAVDDYGNLYGFGDNSYSEMGNRTTASSSTPIKLMGGVKQALAGRYFSVVLTKNGDVYTAGKNDLGQLGTGDNREYAVFQKILSGVMKIAVGKNSCAALTHQGELYVWGDNAQGQLTFEQESINAPQKLAETVYDMAMGNGSMGIIGLDRDVAISGVARGEKGSGMEPLYTFDATVPEEEKFQEIIEMPNFEE